MTNEIEATAYALARLPATYEVFLYVLNELKPYINQISSDPLNTLSWLDLGSGPGTAAWALNQFQENWHTMGDLELINLNAMPSIDLTLVENNPFMLSILNKILTYYKLNQNSSIPHLKNFLSGITILNQDLVSFNLNQSYDFMSLSYVLSELPFLTQEDLLKTLWSKISKGLIIIEPGTPKGFQNILKARNYLIDQGASILAPCGHNGLCPMIRKGDEDFTNFNSLQKPSDWCHFSLNLNRSSFHRYLKEGILPYESEKFSYLIAVKNLFLLTDFNNNKKRILKKPRHFSGHIQLDLCTPEKIQKETFTKLKSSNYRQLKKLNWGDKA